MIDFDLVVFGTNSRALDLLAHAGQKVDYLAFANGNGPAVTSDYHLDAVLMTLMEAEHVGVSPPLKYDEAVVAATPDAARRRGVARYVVGCVRTKPKEPRDWPGELSLLLQASFRAIRSFNENSRDQIRRIGMLADDLLIDRVGVEEAIRIVRHAAEMI